MRFRISLVLVLILLVTAACGGETKHLPSSNPPEFDPKKVYMAPAGPLSAPSTSIKPTQPTELERLRSKLDSLGRSQKATGEGQKVPLDPTLLQLFKGATNPCDALSRLAPGLSNTQIFAGAEGAALKRALGPDADGMARRMDEHLAEALQHSLDPGAADCPISVRPRKKSDLSQPARLVLTHTTSTQPFLLAQTTIPDASQDDYDVQRSVRKEQPPPDWVGWKSTETMMRIGKKPHTEGIREYYEMVIAPKAKRCPDPAGMVEGTVEWSLVMYRATTGPAGEPHGVLYRQLVQATLKGEVDDDAKVKHVDFDVTVTLQHIGTELAHSSHTYGSHGRFTLDQRQKGIPQELKIVTVSGFSESEAQIKDAHLLGSLTALMAYYSGQEYFNAQSEWNKPNTCVEIMFTPATKTKKFSPNESVSVKTELRTKKEQTTVPATFKEAKEKPREGNGAVSPKQAESIAGSPATFTYTMPRKRVKHSGFWVGAVSRAGVAEALNGEWEVADGGMRLRIGNRIWHDPGSPYALSGYAQFDGTVQFEIQLERVAEGWFRGEIMTLRPLVVRHVRPAAHPCTGSGSQTEHWQVSAQADPKTESMVLHWGFTSSDEQASWTCRGPAGTWTDELPISLFSNPDLHKVQMPTKSGTQKDLTGRGKKFLESLNITVLEGMDEQGR
ncbi:MAG: hypothetical protein ACT4PN_06855 [Nitrospiraceae bacterium]